MKIVAIRIKNLASLEGVSEIDFTKEPLKSSGIFAITGPTGAGKSTILDALCLALYAKTPRYLQAKETGIDLQDVAGSKIGQGDIRGILRDGTAEGYAEVEFVGIDEHIYRATWYVRRARDKADGSLQADTVQLRNAATNIGFGGKKTDTLKEIERLVGLNFEQFTRSVLLAQGDFTAFLKADKDSKSSLLEKLTGTNIYSEISRMIFEKYRQADQDLKDLHRQLEGITILSEDELSELNEQKTLLEKDTADVELKSAQIVTQINWYNTLAELKHGKAVTEAALLLAQEHKSFATEREVVLRQVEKVQNIKSQFESRITTLDQLDKKTIELGELKKQTEDLKLKQQYLSIKLNEAEKAEVIQKKKIADSQPEIDKAKETDTLLKEKKLQLDSVTAEFESAELNKQQHLGAISLQKSAIDELSRTVQELQNWKTENQSREAIALHISLITSKLADASQQLSEQGKTTKDLEKATAALHDSIAEKEKIEQEIGVKNVELGLAISDYNVLKAELSGIQIEELKISEGHLIDSLQLLASGKVQWEILYDAEEQYRLLNSYLERNTEQLSVAKKDIATKSILLEKAKIEKEITNKLFTRAQLKATENVETLRAELVESEECPVCGSTSHPFASENPELKLVLKGLEDENNKCTTAYESLLKQFSADEQLVKSLEATITQQLQDVESRAEKLKLLRNKWQQYALAKEAEGIAASSKAEWLLSREARLRSELKSIQEKTVVYTKIKENLEVRKDTIELLEKSLVVATAVLKETEYKRDGFEEVVARLGIQCKQCQKNIESIISILNPYFSKLDWAEHWHANPLQFEQNILQFAEVWTQKSTLLMDSTNNLNILNTRLASLQQQSEIVMASTNLILLKKETVLADFHKLQQQRKQLFDGEDILVVERKLAENLEHSIQLHKGVKLESDQLKDLYLRVVSNDEQLTKDIASFSETINNQNDIITKWIVDYNSKNEEGIDERTLAQLFIYTHDWMELERKELKAIDDKLTVAASADQQRAILLGEHQQKRTTVQTLAELLDSQVAIKETLGHLSNKSTEIQLKLRQDEQNKKSISLHQQEMHTKRVIYDNWAKLNELLGSADGKKFRQIAQEYTLDVLLGYANVHLQLLSSRYKLSRIPATLGLQIFDKDMGDEVRTVFSLSGGESFLVSLALALGLASLSSNKMRVESLFIDEGFGSLDPETLSIAMDALERLHNQGRKVGVISHVQEMTERIPTQIRVSKLSNGKSKIEVTGI